MSPEEWLAQKNQSNKKLTHDGLPARENPDGSYSTEVSITITDPRLNNGKPTNIPSLWGGKEVDEDTAVKNALKSGKNYQSFDTIDSAVSSAKARSLAGGAGADKVMTPEEFMASRKSSEPPKEDKFVNLKEMISSGDQTKKMAEFRKELTTRDPSQAGKMTGGEMLGKAVEGAKTGAMIGGGVGLLGGPAGALGGAGMGGAAGFVGGGLSAIAQQLGYSEKTQQLADMIGAGVVPAQAGIKMIADNKLAQQAGDLVSNLAKSMIPKYGTIRKIASVLPEAKISGRAAEQALGEKAVTAGATTEARDAFKAELQAAHGEGANVSGLYEKAKGAYDEALSKATPETLTAEFNKLGEAFPKASRASSMEKIRNFFVDAKGNPLDGNAVINNIKSDEFKALSKLEQEEVRKAVNDFIPGRAEEVARKAAEKEFVATAKDTLPELFKSNNYNIINKQMGNFAKDEAGQKIFKQELAYYLKNRPVEQAKTLWSNIAPNVKQTLIKDPVQFQKISDVINNAKTGKDVSRAASLLMKAGYISAVSGNQ